MKKTIKPTHKRKTETKPKTEKNLLEVPLYDMEGKEEGKVTLLKAIFSAKVNPDLLSQYVRVYLSNQRQGNASTKTQSEVTGSTKKIYRQKGTGRARHGSIKAPIFVGGGIIGGPKPKDFSLAMNKKQKRKALFSALSLKAKEEDVVAITDSFVSMKPKTKLFNEFLKVMHLDSEKLLVVLPKMEKNNLILAMKNIRSVQFTDAASLNAYTVLMHKKLLFLKKALSVLESNFLKEHGN